MRTLLSVSSPLASYSLVVRTFALRNRVLYFLGTLQEWQHTRKTDTDYERFIGVINTPFFPAPQNGFSSASQQCVRVIDDRTVRFSLSTPQAVFMLCFPSQMQIYLYNSDDFDSLSAAIKERRIISAMAVFFEVKYQN